MEKFVDHEKDREKFQKMFKKTADWLLLKPPQQRIFMQAWKKSFNKIGITLLTEKLRTQED